MSYKAGIVSAITDLADRSGSSMIAIKKAMQEKMPKDKKWQNATFLQALKNGVASGELVQNKNSYKLSADFKKKATATAKKAAKVEAPKKKAATAVKKTTTKKTTAAKPKKAATTKKTSAKKATAPKAKTVKAKAAAKPTKKATATKPKKAASTKAKPAAKAKTEKK